jgi:putative DNA primase/helicase
MALKQMRLAATVVVTFSAGNLQFVASQLRGRRFVFADNDTSGTGQRVAGATSLPWTMSDVVGEDANDLHQRAGLMAVVKLVAKCRR